MFLEIKFQTKQSPEAARINAVCAAMRIINLLALIAARAEIPQCQQKQD